MLVSGACALTYQVAWMREFRLIFGGTTAANAAVVAIFMGGLALGSMLLGSRADRAVSPLGMYAALEAIVALSAAVSPWLIARVRDAYVALGGQSELGQPGAVLARLLLAAAVLAIPTIAMGGTLPALARFATSSGDERRGSLGLLYGLNTLGAVAGAIAATFLLLEHFGTRQTLWLAATFNLLPALTAWRISRRAATSPLPLPPQEEQPAVEFSSGPPEKLSRWTTCTAAALVGLAFFAMELVWYRMLAPLLGGTTYTFGLILAVVLAGIGVGGSIYPLVMQSVRPSARMLALTCGLEALFVAIPFALGDRLAVLAELRRQAAGTSYLSLVVGWIVVAAIVVFPASVVAGVQFPLLISLTGERERNIGRDLGLVFAANTLGAIAGALLGGFVLLPLLSAPGAWLAVVLLLAALGLSLTAIDLRRSAENRARLLTPVAASFLAALCLTAEGPTAAWRHSGVGVGRAIVGTVSAADLLQRLRRIESELIWDEDGREACVALMKNDRGLYFCVTGKSDGHAIGDASTQISLGVLPALLHPEPKSALVVGLGTGETAGWLAEVGSLTSVEVVEIEPVIREVARWCALGNRDVLRNPKVSIIINDAREHLLTCSGRFDLILSEPSNPYRAGVANLFTREFYDSVESRLRPGGLFVQWLQCYEVDLPTIAMVLETARRVFPSVEIWSADQDHDLLLVCSREDLAAARPDLRDRLASDEAYQEAFLTAWSANRFEVLLAHYVGGTATVDALRRRFPCEPVTDDRNRLEFAMVRTLGRHGLTETADLRNIAQGIDDWRPLVADGIDWDLVLDQWAYAAWPALDRSTPSDRVVRTAAMNRLGNDPSQAIALWETQPRRPVLRGEITSMAHASVYLGRADALPLIEQVRAWHPLTADLLLAEFRAVRGEPEAALQLLEPCFRKLHQDPWASQSVIGDALSLSVFHADRDLAAAARLRDELRTPFAMYSKDEARLRALEALDRLLPQSK